MLPLHEMSTAVPLTAVITTDSGLSNSWGRIHVNKMNSTKVQNPWHKMQVALLAEPKTPLESSVSMSSSNKMCLFRAHHKALLCDYTLLRSSVTHARISLPHARNHERSIRRNAENEPVSRIKMADCRALVSMGRYSYLRHYTKNAKFKH